jgi:hypothetical protein
MVTFINSIFAHTWIINSIFLTAAILTGLGLFKGRKR